MPIGSPHLKFVTCLSNVYNPCMQVDAFVDDDLALALRLSEEQERLRQEQMRQEEEEMLAKVLELSLQEK